MVLNKFISTNEVVNGNNCSEKSINGKSINGLLMHAERAQYDTCRRSVLYHTCVFNTQKVWCQLTHLHERLRRSLAYYR